MDGELFTVEPLSATHDRIGFDCGSEALNRYFRTQASQDTRRRIATCFVAVCLDSQEVAGFYTLTATSIALGELPAEQIARLPRYPAVPAALLGRLAVARSYQGRGLGADLLIDAVKRAVRTELGVVAMLVEAKDEAAQRFYERCGFRPIETAGRRLVLPIAAAEHLILRESRLRVNEPPATYGKGRRTSRRAALA